MYLHIHTYPTPVHESCHTWMSLSSHRAFKGDHTNVICVTWFIQTWDMTHIIISNVTASPTRKILHCQIATRARVENHPSQHEKVKPRVLPSPIPTSPLHLKRNRLCIFRVPPRFHDHPSRGHMKICGRWLYVCVIRVRRYGVATIRRLLKMIGLFCKRAV